MSAARSLGESDTIGGNGREQGTHMEAREAGLSLANRAGV